MSRTLTRAFVVVIAVVCVVVGSSIAWSTLAGSTGAPPYANKADFDRAFADAAAGHRAFKPSDVEKLRNSAWKLISSSR
jgi:hypothetical protein